MLCTFSVKSPPGCKISLYLHPSIYAINIDLELSDSCFPLARSSGNVASENSCLSFSSSLKSRKYWFVCSIVIYSSYACIRK